VIIPGTATTAAHAAVDALTSGYVDCTETVFDATPHPVGTLGEIADAAVAAAAPHIAAAALSAQADRFAETGRAYEATMRKMADGEIEHETDDVLRYGTYAMTWLNAASKLERAAKELTK
jgi:hypothetical protein